MRWRIHSLATKIGQRMWNRKLLCSNGVPCRSRIRNRIRPRSASSSSSLRRAKLTRAAFATERSSAIEASRRTKPWSRSSTRSPSPIAGGVTGAGPSISVVTLRVYDRRPIRGHATGVGHVLSRNRALWLHDSGSEDRKRLLPGTLEVGRGREHGDEQEPIPERQDGESHVELRAEAEGSISGLEDRVAVE